MGSTICSYDNNERQYEQAVPNNVAYGVPMNAPQHVDKDFYPYVNKRSV